MLGKKKFGLAFDPGYVNLGVALLDLETDMGVMAVVDVSHYGGCRHSLGYADYGPLMYDMVRSLPDLLGVPIMWDRMGYVGIEQQPTHGAKPVLQCASHIESCIRMMLPHVPIIQANPIDVRKYWFTGGGNYTERKDNSMTTSLLSKEDTKHAFRAFAKRGSRGKAFSVDGIEAMQLCVYVKHNLKRIMVPKTESVPRKFACLKMRAEKVFPSTVKLVENVVEKGEEDEECILEDDEEEDEEEEEEEVSRDRD